METSPSYTTLEEIRLRKAQLVADMRQDEKRINKEWNRLVHPKRTGRSSASSRLNSIVATGTGVFDAALLGWKLYRKFSGKQLFGFKLRGKKR